MVFNRLQFRFRLLCPLVKLCKELFKLCLNKVFPSQIPLNVKPFDMVS